jgi:hypothetical protein
MLYSFVFASVNIIESQTTDVYATLGLTKVKYNMNIQSRYENVKVTQ